MCTDDNKSLQVAIEKIPKFDDPELWQDHKDWKEPRSSLVFTYTINGNIVTLVGVSHSQDPESETNKGTRRILEV